MYYCVLIYLDFDSATATKVACNAIIVMWITHSATPCLPQICFSISGSCSVEVQVTTLRPERQKSLLLLELAGTIS